MPIHEFRCSSCEYIFELLIMNREEMDALRCPKCQSPEVNKLMSASNFATNGPRVSNTDGGKSSVKQHSCGTGSCTSFELSGHKP